MRLSRPQFTMRWLMIAVGMMGMVLAGEIRLFDICKNVVSDGGDGVDYIPGEAITVWSIIQVPILLILLSLYWLYGTVRTHFTKRS